MFCYCQSGQSFKECCALFIQGQHLPASAEQLMRSRFSAYCEGSAQAMQYLAQSYHPKSQAENPVSEITAFAKVAHFISLEIIQSSDPSLIPGPLQQQLSEWIDPEQDLYATVHFKARFIMHDKLHLLEESSRFIRSNQQWLYLDGAFTEHAPQKLSRNDSCPCRSGKKYKHCQPHLSAAHIAAQSALENG